MDAPAWLGLEPTHNPMRWVLPVTPGISTGHQFLFGGCGLLGWRLFCCSRFLGWGRLLDRHALAVDEFLTLRTLDHRRSLFVLSWRGLFVCGGRFLLGRCGLTLGRRGRGVLRVASVGLADRAAFGHDLLVRAWRG